MPTEVRAARTEGFASRHIGPSPEDVRGMLETLGLKSLDALTDAAVPPAVRAAGEPLGLGPGRSEPEMLRELRELASRNRTFRSFIGMGYHDCFTPPVIQRNILENPGWYTAYTPYQAEISQGRLEALLNFQTLVMDLTGLEVANASLLDEATAAAEAMAMSFAARTDAERRRYFISSGCHPQTIAVVRARAEPLGIEVEVADHESRSPEGFFGALLQYPATDGAIHDYGPFCERARGSGCLVAAAADPLALVLLAPPGEFGADIAVGSVQRFGVPMGYGGPHAAYLAAKDAYRRLLPGRIVGVSKDGSGRRALRLALQTREQHIRREKATSNICTAQVLPAVMASMYAVYHGPEGLRDIARRVRRLARRLAQGLRRLGYETGREPFFDTVRVELGRERTEKVLAEALRRRINLRRLGEGSLCAALDETSSQEDVRELLEAFALGRPAPSLDAAEGDGEYEPPLRRSGSLLAHPVFRRHRSETGMLRYIRGLEAKDLSLTHSMIPLGSCTMKLNATAEMLPVTWPEFSRLHPFAPRVQAEGYQLLFEGLEGMIRDMTGFDAVSLMPNAGSQGEYAGLSTIRAYHKSRADGGRDVCLIPRSAHGTNPASAAMAGLRVVPVECDGEGNVDLADLRVKAERHAKELAALMVTYPSTHGVYEGSIRDIAAAIHAHGGQVYMDGANLNALIGLSKPARLGADVCHLNLHKTFCIPHGGGGPGMGPIAVKAHLAPFLPTHPLASVGGERGIGPVSAAPWGSAGILPISWAYIRLMGSEGLRRATQAAILNANYVARRLEPYYPVLYKGTGGLVAHECILDLRPLKPAAQVEDVAKRLMDYGFHAPTVSWPVPGTMMVEPTESESKEELDRFCEAMISIHAEARDILEGRADPGDNVLKNAPHTAEEAASDRWPHPYSREKAVFPAPWCRERKFWPPVGRIDNVYGDRNFFCSCPAPEEG